MNTPHGMFPVRHWFDDNEDLSQQESVSDAVIDAGNVPVTASQNTVNRRDAQSSPLTRTLYADSGREDEIQQPSPGADGTTGTESRRPPTRSASRGGRIRSSVDTTISGAIDSRDGSSIVDELSPMNVASAAALSNSDSPPISPSLFHGPERRRAGDSPVETGSLRRRHVNQMPYANELFSPGVVLLPHDQQGRALHQPESRGRRSLSDFLREVEEMVRAQRAEGMGRAYPFAPPMTEHSSGRGGADSFPVDERQVQHQPFVPNTSEQRRGRGQGQQLAVRPGRSSGDAGGNDSGPGESRANRRRGLILLGDRSRTGGGVGLRDANAVGAASSSAGTIQRQGLMGPMVDRDSYNEFQQRGYVGNPARGDFSSAARAITADVRPGHDASRAPRGDTQQEEMQSIETSSSSSGAVGSSPRGNMDESRETQLSRPGAQWQAIRSESLPSDGTLTLSEPSPRGFDCKIPGREDPDEDAIEVEKSLFSSLTSLGVRRLLVMSDKGMIANSNGPHSGTYRSPEWLNEWLEDGGRLTNSSCGGAYGDDLRCPQFGDLWELLELVIAWWSERVCAVAAGIPISREGRREERMGLVSGDPVSAARAVEAVQDLREFTKSFIPLAQVRYFIAAPGGPTPREAVILKIILVIHEGLAWAIDRPRHRYYREEVIPTALEFYANLPQGILEGVDVEVGHKLPEAMFLITGVARPSWQHHRRRFSNGYGYGGRGVGIAEEEEEEEDNNRSSGRGEGSLSGISWSAGGFEPGPWVIFRLTQTEYLEFYAGQAIALDEATGGMGDMLC